MLRIYVRWEGRGRPQNWGSKVLSFFSNRCVVRFCALSRYKQARGRDGPITSHTQYRLREFIYFINKVFRARKWTTPPRMCDTLRLQSRYIFHDPTLISDIPRWVEETLREIYAIYVDYCNVHYSINIYYILTYISMCVCIYRNVLHVKKQRR